MGELFTPTHLILILSFFFPLLIIPYWQILKKAGFPPVLSLLIVVPLCNLLLLYYVAFAKWKTESREV
jgi:hypothetical protein